MKSKNNFKIKLMDKNGQGVMEYIIISSLIGIFCLVAMREFGGVIHKRIEYMQKAIVENIKIN